MRTPNDWLYGDHPTEDGWYAVAICWDIQEGLFPGSRKWKDSKWEDAPPIVAYAGPFLCEKDAEDWAYEHDMES